MVTTRVNNTDVTDLLFTYFGIPTRLTEKTGTFTFASPFNQDFYLYTPADSVTIPQGTEFTYTQSQTGESATQTFTFTEELSTPSIGEILTYIDTHFLKPTYNKAGDTSNLINIQRHHLVQRLLNIILKTVHLVVQHPPQLLNYSIY